MKEKVLITGANGQLAQKLGQLLNDNLYDICYLSTNKKLKSKKIFYWNLKKQYIDNKALVNVVHIIHLAGFNISNNWISKNKKIMFDSRVKTSELLYSKCKELNIIPKTFISASAMGYYGLKENGKKKENDLPVNDWLSNLCVNWERAADKFNKLGSRVVKLRLSLILDEDQGVLKKILFGYKFKIGVVFGNGKQHFPWIYIDDVTRFILFILRNQNIIGVFNVANTENNSYYDVIKRIKNKKYPRSILLFLPKWFMKFILGEKANLLFSNISICVNKMKATKFKWNYEKIENVIEKG